MIFIEKDINICKFFINEALLPSQRLIMPYESTISFLPEKCFYNRDIPDEEGERDCYYTILISGESKFPAFVLRSQLKLRYIVQKEG
jgi:hypothetical protein